MLGLRKGASYASMPAHHGIDLKRVMNPAKAAREDARTQSSDSWTPPVLSAIAAKGEGIRGIRESLDKHFGYLEMSGKLRERRRERMVERVTEVVEKRMRQRLRQRRNCQLDKWKS
jgi:Putative periplasmic protein kinase ArgK and related GTPases of G3E family